MCSLAVSLDALSVVIEPTICEVERPLVSPAHVDGTLAGEDHLQIKAPTRWDAEIRLRGRANGDTRTPEIDQVGGSGAHVSNPGETRSRNSSPPRHRSGKCFGDAHHFIVRERGERRQGNAAARDSFGHRK